MFDERISRDFANAWTDAISSGSSALRLREVRRLDYQSFKEQLRNADEDFIRSLVDSIYAGDVYVLLDAYNPEILTNLRQRVFEYAHTRPSSVHKMIDGCPDNHSRRDWQTEDQGGYSSTYHLLHFFRWNDDPLGVFELFKELYQIMKVSSGLSPNSFEKNIPSDGTIDRIEISHYPSGVGGIGFHTDPIGNIRFMCTVTLTEFGRDYKLGGFAVADRENKIHPIEPLAPLGSIVGFLPSICHGVEVIDPDHSADWESIAGRWYVGLSSVDSETVQNRAITRPVQGLPTLREQIAKYQKSPLQTALP